MLLGWGVWPVQVVAEAESLLTAQVVSESLTKRNSSVCCSSTYNGDDEE